jgi:hypothetical protein
VTQHHIPEASKKPVKTGLSALESRKRVEGSLNFVICNSHLELLTESLNGTKLFAIMEGKEIFEECIHPFCDEIFNLQQSDLEIYPEEVNTLTIANIYDDIGEFGSRS